MYPSFVSVQVVFRHGWKDVSFESLDDVQTEHFIEELAREQNVASKQTWTTPISHRLPHSRT
jgi:hypothetical protein